MSGQKQKLVKNSKNSQRIGLLTDYCQIYIVRPKVSTIMYDSSKMSSGIYSAYSVSWEVLRRRGASICDHWWSIYSGPLLSPHGRTPITCKAYDRERTSFAKDNEILLVI